MNQLKRLCCGCWGINSSGEGRASHAWGSVIDARILHKYSCYVVCVIAPGLSLGDVKANTKK